MEYCMSRSDRCPVIDSEWKLLLHRADASRLLFVPHTFLTTLHQQVMLRGRQSATSSTTTRQLALSNTHAGVCGVNEVVRTSN